MASIMLHIGQTDRDAIVVAYLEAYDGTYGER